MSPKRATIHWIVLAAVSPIGFFVTYRFLLKSDFVLGPVSWELPYKAERMRRAMAFEYSLFVWVPVLLVFAFVPSFLHQLRALPPGTTQHVATGPLVWWIGKKTAIGLQIGLLAVPCFRWLVFTDYVGDRSLLYWCFFFARGGGFYITTCASLLAVLVRTTWLKWCFYLLASVALIEQFRACAYVAEIKAIH